MTVRVPATSANLGPGFDVLGLALSLHAEFGVYGVDEPPERHVVADEHHPATVAFRRAGGTGEVWVASPIPMGRGLGYSGAMRVGGALLGCVHSADGGAAAAHRDHDDTVLAIAAELEGHADNVAASLVGGVVVVTGGRVVRVPLAVDPAVVVWVPSATTSTDTSRTVLPTHVTLDDAVVNIGRAAALVAALAGGDIDALRLATDDRVHQQRRLDAQPASRRALDAGLASNAWCGWLSGSGPSVAFLVGIDGADDLAAALPDDGHTKVLRIDHEGAVVETPAGGNGS